MFALLTSHYLLIFSRFSSASFRISSTVVGWVLCANGGLILIIGEWFGCNLIF
jgi:hypothetical protein